MASQETLQRVESIVAILFNLPQSEVGPDSSPDTIEAWDSMGQLTLILEIEQEFGVAMTHERTERIKTVASIADIIDEAGAE